MNINNVKYVNIGSCSIPKDNIKQYAILDDVLTVYTLEGEEIHTLKF